MTLISHQCTKKHTQEAGAGAGKGNYGPLTHQTPSLSQKKEEFYCMLCFSDSINNMHFVYRELFLKR